MIVLSNGSIKKRFFLNGPICLAVVFHAISMFCAIINMAYVFLSHYGEILFHTVTTSCCCCFQTRYEELRKADKKSSSAVSLKVSFPQEGYTLLHIEWLSPSVLIFMSGGWVWYCLFELVAFH